MPEEPHVTFDQWWDEAKKHGPPFITEDARFHFEACWDTAVESCAAIVGNAEGVDFGICGTLKKGTI
jgi:hypothetical protein